MQKQHWTIILLVVVILGGLFYWYEWRPSQIKKECSWTHKHQNEINFQPAVPPKSEQELMSEYRQCKNAKQDNCEIWDKIRRNLNSGDPEILAEPARDWWEPATPSEYSFCIHEGGL